MDNLRQSSFFIGSTYGSGSQVGSFSQDVTLPTLLKVPPPKLKTEKSILADVSPGLLFDEEVVRERCFHTLPYDDKYFYKAVDPSDLVKVPKPVRVAGPMGRHNKPGPSSRHMPCIRRQRRKSSTREKANVESLKASASYIPEYRPEVKYLPKKVHSLQHGQSRWDEYVLSILSKNTANWIVTHEVDTDHPKKHKFESLVHDWHGSDLGSELIRDNASDVDAASEVPDSDQPAEKGAWRKRQEQNLLARVRAETSSRLPSDPYSTHTNASFYRLPAGIRRQRKDDNKHAQGTVNKLAAKIEIVRRAPPPPSTLRDHLPAGVGDKILETDNEFQQEMLTGTRQTHQADNDRLIIMESENKYEKQVQEAYPLAAGAWSHARGPPPPPQAKLRKGFHRWRALPSLMDENANVVGSQAELEEIEFNKASDAASKRKARSNSSLLKILEEWRSKWFLNSRYADATTEDLLRDMADGETSIRLKAVMTLSRAMEYNPEDDGINIDQTTLRVQDRVGESLLQGLRILLEDAEDRVRTAAAITLYALSSVTDKAEQILRDKVSSTSPVDRWAAVQCLAHYGVCDCKVVGELVDQLMTSEDAVRHEQATHLLAQLSSDIHKSGLVYSMLAEHLNSTNWRHKVIACKTLPVLGGSITKDIANKLTHLMWFDWHKEVRKAAAQCLGRTGHGKDVHDDLIQRLQDPSEKIRADAVSRLGYLGIMTAKLLPIFLERFADEHVMIREEVCIACGNLALRADDVISRLVEHARYDPIWRVKALAIQSLGKTGVLSEAVRLCVLWALRYETEAAIRAEACQAIIKLQLTDDETADILQDRYLVETSPVVQLVIIEALTMLGISPAQDMQTVARVKQEVRKLCAKDNISSQIVLNELREERKENMARFLCQEKGKLIVEGEPLHAERLPSNPAAATTAEAELEAIPEEDEWRQQASRPLTSTSSFFSYLSEEESVPGSPASASPAPSQSRAASNKSARRLASRGDKTRTNRLEEPGYRSSLEEESAPYAPTPAGRSSIRSSIFGALPRTGISPAPQTRTPLKFHYVMANIDSFTGLDLTNVIGTLTLNRTISGDVKVPCKGKPKTTTAPLEKVFETSLSENKNCTENSEENGPYFSDSIKKEVSDVSKPIAGNPDADISKSVDAKSSSGVMKLEVEIPIHESSKSEHATALEKTNDSENDLQSKLVPDADISEAERDVISYTNSHLGSEQPNPECRNENFSATEVMQD